MDEGSGEDDGVSELGGPGDDYDDFVSIETSEEGEEGLPAPEGESEHAESGDSQGESGESDEDEETTPELEAEAEAVETPTKTQKGPRPRQRPRPVAAAPPPRPPGSKEREGGNDARARLIVAPEERITSNRMTLAEITRAIALRAEQIATYPSPYIEIGDLSDPAAIAKAELFARRSPLLLYRDIGRTCAGERITEVWPVRLMTYPPLG
jgi:hypothetical protein